MKMWSRLLPLCALAGGLLLMAGVAQGQLLITGNDEKVWFDETGKTVNQPPGKDTVSIIDIREPAKPRILASLPLMNTIIGPPVNLAITPTSTWRSSPIHSTGSRMARAGRVCPTTRSM